MTGDNIRYSHVIIHNNKKTKKNTRDRECTCFSTSPLFHILITKHDVSHLYLTNIITVFFFMVFI